MSSYQQRRSAAQWQAILTEFESSNETRQSFCKRKGLAQATFYQWRKRLSQSTSLVPSPPADFVEVAVQPTQRVTGIVLRLDGGVHIECPTTMPLHAVAELAQALRHES